jgi:hypothetical protein
MSEEQERKIDLVEDWRELSFEQKIEALKATISVPDLAAILGLEPDVGDKVPSPWNPDERTPSCHLYDDHFWDYSTGKGGDIFDLFQAFAPDEKLGSIMEQLKNGALRAGLEVGDVERRRPNALLDFSTELELLQGAHLIDVWDGMHVTPFGLIRHDGDTYVLHREPGRVYGVKVRYGSGGKGSWAGSQFTHRLYDPFGWPDGYAPQPWVIITEGESDAWAMIHATEGVDVLALPSGSGSWKDHWLDDLTPYDRVYLCFDNDRAGQEALEKVTRRIGWARAHQLKVPALYNDAREAIKAGWRPSFTP